MYTSIDRTFLCRRKSVPNVRSALDSRTSTRPCGQGGEFGKLHCKLGHTVGSNPSLDAVSQKREFFTCLPETIGYSAPATPKIGAWRLVANLQKPAIGGPFWGYYGRIL